MRKTMQFEDYQTQASKTAIYSDADVIIYPALGLFSESGEVAGKVKKVLRDNNGQFLPEHREAIADEVGDCLWYIASLATDLGFGMEEIAQRNLDKLNSRMARNVIQGSGDNR
jgi:NTP pyrophosphatase (non-canonical NTP hydrolase)